MHFPMIMLVCEEYESRGVRSWAAGDVVGDQGAAFHRDNQQDVVGSWARRVGERSMDKACNPWFPEREKGLNNSHLTEGM